MKRFTMLALSGVAGGLLLAAPGRSSAQEQAVEHTIRAGDNLHLIAGYYYRDPRQWRRIWKDNRRAVPDPSRIRTGGVLLIEESAGSRWEIPFEDFRSRVRGQ